MQNANDTVFEYLIDQLRQQVNKKDVTSFNVPVRISDLDDVKQVIHNLQQHIAGKDDEIRALKDSLRQQVNNNQCEDLTHEVQSLKSELARYKKPYIAYVKKTDWVQGDSRFLKKWGKHRADILRECIQEQDAEIQSLKNQLRDASALVAELQKELDIANSTVVRLRKEIAKSTGNVQEYIDVTEQSGCRKEDARECRHEFVHSKHKSGLVCFKCGARKECEHEWQFYGVGFPCMCLKCGLKK